MTEKLAVCLDQLSPLMESAVKLICAMPLSPSEHIAIGFLATADFSMRIALAIPQCDEELTDEQRDCILRLLAKKKRDADEVMRAASEKFMCGRMQ